MTFIKCCGMFREQDIQAVNAAMPDYCGFVINFPKSHRNVTPQQVLDFKKLLDPRIKSVGVFVNEDVNVVGKLVNDGGIDVAQLHGNEDDAYIAQLRQLCDAQIFKAFKVRSNQDVQRAVVSTADMILLDNGYGTGEVFDWNAIGTIDRPFILAGGLNPENLAEAIDAIHPWGVDLSSGLEIDKVKDAELIAQAVAAVKG